MAGSTLVPNTFNNANSSTNSSENIPINSHSSTQKKQNTPSAPKIKIDGLFIIRKKFIREGLSRKLIDIIMQSWRDSSIKQYKVYLNRWILFCEDNSLDPLERNDLLALEFLRKLLKQGYSYSSINSARSALSIIFDNPNFGELPIVSRFMKSVYNIRPNLPRYTSTWDVSIVLKYLEQCSPIKFYQDNTLLTKLFHY